MPRCLRPAACLPVILLLLLAIPTWAQTSIEVSPETTIAIGGEVLGPEEVGEDDLAGTVSFTGVGVALPAGSNVVGSGAPGAAIPSSARIPR